MAVGGCLGVVVTGALIAIGVLVHRQAAQYERFYADGARRLVEVQVLAQEAKDRAEWAATLRLSREALRLWFLENCGGPPPEFDAPDER